MGRTGYVLGIEGERYDWTDDYRAAVDGREGVVHLWTTMKTDPWPAALWGGPHDRPPAACGEVWLEANVYAIEEAYDSLDGYIFDPAGCEACRWALAERHNYPTTERKVAAAGGRVDADTAEALGDLFGDGGGE